LQTALFAVHADYDIYVISYAVLSDNSLDIQSVSQNANLVRHMTE